MTHASNCRMHDFGVSRKHTILLNLPLTLSPANLFSLPPVPLIHFDRTLPSEFVVFPRLEPEKAIRYTQPEPSLIFHTANSWDDDDTVNMLGCRFKSAKLVYAAGAVDVPRVERFDDVVRLHYYRFGTGMSSFPLAAIPFEFPSIPADLCMSKSRYVYGCTMKSGSFDERLGGAAKVDCLVKVDVEKLIEQGLAGDHGIDDPVDKRTTAECLSDPTGPIQIFACPDGWFAQETRFVPRFGDEDDGYLLTYSELPYCTPLISVRRIEFVARRFPFGRWVGTLGDRCEAHEPGHVVRCLPYRAASARSLWVSRRFAPRQSAAPLPLECAYASLHGTWLPSSLTSRQRPSPPIPQPLLQDKLARSRVQAFVSIIFSRPSHREKSLFERVLLALMWPSAVGFLGLAILECYRAI